MAIQKIEIRPEGVNDYGDVVYPKTSADMVVEVTDKKFMTDAERTKLIGIEEGARKLVNVDNIKQMPIAGDTFTGIATAHSNTSYTVRQMRNIILSTGNAVLSSMQDGDIWIKYK